MSSETVQRKANYLSKIKEYTNKGFYVVNETGTSVQLKKDKKFIGGFGCIFLLIYIFICWPILFLILPGSGGALFTVICIVYFTYHLFVKKDKYIYINIDEYEGDLNHLVEKI
jgi:hypothetical protein